LSTKTDSVRLYKVRKLISELASKEGRGTELVSLYVPPKKPIHEVIANLREEWGTAGNIKSDTTRNHVQDALTKTMQKLKLYRTAPETGLVIFSGALPTNGPGSEVVNLYEIVPPKPVTAYLYMCDDHFHLDWLKDMLREDKVFGILSIDASEAGLGILSGDSLEIPDLITSGISGKTRKGGQSARRYERGREMELTYYYHRVAEHATRVFLEGAKVTGMIVGGPGPTKRGVPGDSPPGRKVTPPGLTRNMTLSGGHHAGSRCGERGEAISRKDSTADAWLLPEGGGATGLGNEEPPGADL
jgi:peptide chain release factor subunit 1